MPEGTVVRDLHTGEVLADLVHHGDRWLAAAGGRGGRGNATLPVEPPPGPELRRAGRARRGALAEARAEADGRRGPRRLPERRQEHLHQPHLGGQAQDRRLPVHHARAPPRRRAARRRLRDRRRRHPRPHRGRQRGPGPRPPVPAPRRAGPGAVRPGRPRLASSERQPRASRTRCCCASSAPTGPSCSSARACVVGTKADVATWPWDGLRISAVTGEGVPEVLGALRVAGRARPAPGRAARPTGFVIHRPAARGRRASSASASTSSASSAGPALRAVALSDLTNADALAYVDHRLKQLGVDKALAQAGAGARRRRADRRLQLRLRARAGWPADGHDRRQDRHVVADRRRAGSSTSARS